MGRELETLLVKSSVKDNQLSVLHLVLDKTSYVQACVDKTEVKKSAATPNEPLGKKHPIALRA